MGSKWNEPVVPFLPIEAFLEINLQAHLLLEFLDRQPLFFAICFAISLKTLNITYILGSVSSYNNGRY